MKAKGFFLVAFLFLALRLTAQEKAPDNKNDNPNKEVLSLKLEKKKTTEKSYKPFNPLAPAKAAFYSAILPGLGQAYNGTYWKIPIIYAGFGLSIYNYIRTDREYERYRDAYKRRLAGYEDDEFQGLLTMSSLIDAQEFYERQKEIWLFVTIGIYVLNIVDANVTAHLQQFNVSKDLSLSPSMNHDRLTGINNYGLSLNLRF